jgi:DNA-cytosine methyltransferase
LEAIQTLALTVGDVFCGAGGFSEGFRQAGFEIRWALDNWPPAAETFEKNQGVKVISNDIFKTDFKALERVDVLIGGPPCQNFSLAKKGGNGDAKEGMKLVLKFLEAVLELEPRYWIMENVPNLQKTLVDHISGKAIVLPNGVLDIRQMKILNSADYGVPQRRRRLFVGKFPTPAETHTGDGETVLGAKPRWKSMKDVIDTLPHPLRKLKSTRIVKDPLYNIEIPEDQVTEQSYDTYLTAEQVFLCRKKKQDHIWGGKMSFPEKLDLPSRTITAGDFKSCRQTIVIRDGLSHGTSYRRPTLRELACFQSFPITYQFWGKTAKERKCLVGNAVPPLLSFALAKAILVHTGYAPTKEPKIRCMSGEIPPPLAIRVVTGTKRNTPISLETPFRDYIPGSMTGHQKDSCRVDLDNKGSHPRPHPMTRFGFMGQPIHSVEHIVEWRTVLCTGYAKEYKSSAIELRDAILLLVQAKREGLLDVKKIDSFINDLKDLPHLVPDASTLQATRARRWEKVNVAPYDLLAIIRDKVEYHFPMESFEWSNRIKNSRIIRIAPKTGLPVRTAAYLLACSFICDLLNESDVWIKENPGLDFHKKEWPQIARARYSFAEPVWNGYSILKEEICHQMKR